MFAAMIMCHKNLKQVHRLVQALSHPEIDIFIHIDQKCTENYPITRLDSGNIYFVENVVIITYYESPDRKHYSPSHSLKLKIFDRRELQL